MSLTCAVDSAVNAADLVRRAVDGDDDARRGLVQKLTPILRARVTRRLARRAPGRSTHDHAEDMIQDVFLSIFAEDARVLRAWDPGRGLSLANFIGLVTERYVVSTQRTLRRNPWTEEPTSDEEIAAMSGAIDETEAQVAARDLVGRLVGRLSAELSPLGMQLFQLLYIEELPIERIADDLQMSRTAVYVWRHRLAKAARRCAEELGCDYKLAG